MAREGVGWAVFGCGKAWQKVQMSESRSMCQLVFEGCRGSGAKIQVPESLMQAYLSNLRPKPPIQRLAAVIGSFRSRLFGVMLTSQILCEQFHVQVSAPCGRSPGLLGGAVWAPVSHNIRARSSGFKFRGPSNLQMLCIKFEIRGLPAML